jgi:RecA-family ATPase
MSAVTPGANENSGEDVGKLIEHCKLLNKKTGALVILIHHSGKDSL